MKKNKKTLLALLVLVLLVLSALLLRQHFSPAAAPGEKTITVEVVHADGSARSVTLTTAAERLSDALLEEKLAAGEEGPYGLYLTTVDGETAEEAAQEWWCLTKNGEILMTGVSDTVLADGDRYELTFTVGYDTYAG